MCVLFVSELPSDWQGTPFRLDVRLTGCFIIISRCLRCEDEKVKEFECGLCFKFVLYNLGDDMADHSNVCLFKSRSCEADISSFVSLVPPGSSVTSPTQKNICKMSVRLSYVRSPKDSSPFGFYEQVKERDAAVLTLSSVLHHRQTERQCECGFYYNIGCADRRLRSLGDATLSSACTGRCRR